MSYSSKMETYLVEILKGIIWATLGTSSYFFFKRHPNTIAFPFCLNRTIVKAFLKKMAVSPDTFGQFWPSLRTHPSVSDSYKRKPMALAAVLPNTEQLLSFSEEVQFISSNEGTQVIFKMLCGGQTMVEHNMHIAHLKWDSSRNLGFKDNAAGLRAKPEGT